MKDSTILVSVKGKSVKAPCLIVDERSIVIKGRIFRIASVFDDFLDSRGIDNPESIILALKEKSKADVFSFYRNFSIVLSEKKEPALQKGYKKEYEHHAGIRVVSYDHWWRHDIKKQTRRRVRKAKEKDVEIRQVPLDDNLIQGITRIFNETPIRQGKPFWHYGKDFHQVKNEISTYAESSIFLGAYWKSELIGFSKLINCGVFGRANQLISMVRHRDKLVTNALIAELVRTCESKRIPNLLYGDWIEGSLGHFKKNNGFKRVTIPKYYKALTLEGRVVLRMGIHKGIREFIPNPIRTYLRSLRRLWHK